MIKNNKLVIHWWNFSNNMFIELPEEYRIIMFQLISLKFNKYDRLMNLF